MSGERPKSIQEWRGIKPPPPDREKKYSAESYAAQYGITVEDAESLREECSSHPEIERRILAMFRSDPALKRRAMMLDEFSMSPQEIAEAEAIARRWGFAGPERREGGAG